jgi:hypothetical protein
MTGIGLSIPLLVTSVAVALGVSLPDQRLLVLVAWAIVMLCYSTTLVYIFARRLTVTAGSPFDKTLRQAQRSPARPEDLKRSERLLGWKVYASRDFDYHVRPHLRELTSERALRRSPHFGIDTNPSRLVDDPELQSLLGDAGGEELYGETVATEDIARIVSKIEQL